MKIFKFKFILSSLVVLVVLKSSAQVDVYSTENLKGKIMSLSEIYEEKTSLFEKNLLKDLNVFFNERGQVIKQAVGNLGYEFLYDHAGNNVQMIAYSNGDSIGFISYLFNVSNQLIEERNNARKLKSYSYDSLGNQLSQVTYAKNEKIESRYIYVYDESGALLEKKYYIASGFSERLAENYKYTYDERGYCTEILQEFCDATFYKTSFKVTRKYDNIGRWIEEEKYTDTDEFVSKESATYDEHGNQITFSRYNAFGAVTELNIYEYKYDETGNWLQKSSFRDGQLLIVQKREITYFP